jgi:hypothetical protein
MLRLKPSYMPSSESLDVHIVLSKTALESLLFLGRSDDSLSLQPKPVRAAY